MSNLNLTEHELVLCDACRRDTGSGHNVLVTYGSAGGFSPIWEGRMCVHISAAQVLADKRNQRVAQCTMCDKDTGCVARASHPRAILGEWQCNGFGQLIAAGDVEYWSWKFAFK